ncbi:MAG TPA: hypothetical protein VKB86_02895 [Pyrinomonadaceae bacterium]|nr:hypothetical protein [Pyrinomonadaceae bacterium]
MTLQDSAPCDNLLAQQAILQPFDASVLKGTTLDSRTSATTDASEILAIRARSRSVFSKRESKGKAPFEML